MQLRYFPIFFVTIPIARGLDGSVFDADDACWACPFHGSAWNWGYTLW